jgi:hypothetical protein
MKRRTIARLIAAVLLSYGMAFVLSASHKTELVQYRSLSHAALLDTLAKNRETDFNSSFGQSLLGVGLIVALVELVASLIVLVINRIAPPHPPGGTTPVADASGIHFH